MSSEGDVLSRPQPPHHQILHPLLSRLQIRLKNSLWRHWHDTREHALKVEVNRLKTSVTRRFNGWRNDE